MVFLMAIRAFIRVLGGRTCPKAKELISFRIIPNTKGNFIMGYHMAEASILTSCSAMKAPLVRACFMAKECYSIKQDKLSKATYSEIALKREYTSTQTATFTAGISNRTKSLGKANINQPTETITKAISKKESVPATAQ